MTKNGVSTVVATVILVALTVVLSGIVWAIVNNLVKTETEKTSCFGVSEKIKINYEYTCYDAANQEMQISIDVYEIELSSVLFYISGVANSATFEILNKPSLVFGARMYDGSEEVYLPEKNAGLTYRFDASNVQNPAIIKIIPSVKNRNCEVADMLSDIGSC
jgi:FlaG/FlaF family flagellin (archaellin)